MFENNVFILKSFFLVLSPDLETFLTISCTSFSIFPSVLSLFFSVCCESFSARHFSRYCYSSRFLLTSAVIFRVNYCAPFLSLSYFVYYVFLYKIPHYACIELHPQRGKKSYILRKLLSLLFKELPINPHFYFSIFFYQLIYCI